MANPSARPATRLVAGLLDLLYPRRCGGCGAIGAWLCPACLATIEPPAVPGWVCAGCDRALLTAPGALYCADLCAPDGLTAVLSTSGYGGPLRSAIHHFKYDGWRVLAMPLAGLLAATCAAYAGPWPDDHVPYLVPIPLHPRRRQQRGFNQAALLAQALGARLDWPMLPGLVRVRNTLSQAQARLTPAERALNLEGAFAWRGPVPPPAGPILLIDDVYTTGVTLGEAAETLRAAGAGPVYGLTLARAGAG